MNPKDPSLRRPRHGARGRRTRLALAGAPLLAAALLLTTPLEAAPKAGPALDQAEVADIARIERYLNNMRTMTARFLQSTSEGGYAEGTVFLSRPGRLRIEYDPPVPVLIVADGTWIHFYDAELGQVNRLRLTETPAAVLVRERFDFDEEVKVTAFKRGPGTIRLTLEDSANPESGTLTLVFSDRPLMLRQWVVNDAQGVETTVAIYDSRRDVPLAPMLFEFHDPTKPRVPFGQ
ncbi:MAG: outer membrane lipoprotein carrier protein LolA [Alphaproteobacteria bacterium]